MAKQTNIYQPKGFNTVSQTFVNADGTTTKDLIAAGADDSAVKSLVATSTDSSANVLSLIQSDGSTDILIGAYPIPALAGTNGSAPAVDLLAAPWLPLIEGKRVLPLKTGYKLRAAMQNAVSSSLQVAVAASGIDY